MKFQQVSDLVLAVIDRIPAAPDVKLNGLVLACVVGAKVMGVDEVSFRLALQKTWDQVRITPRGAEVGTLADASPKS